MKLSACDKIDTESNFDSGLSRIIAAYTTPCRVNTFGLIIFGIYSEYAIKFEALPVGIWHSTITHLVKH